MTTESAHRLERWEALERPIMSTAPYVLLALSAAGALAIDNGSQTKSIIDAAGAAAAGAWMFGIVTLHPQWVERRTLMAVFFAGLTAISGVLVVNDPIFGFFSWTGYIWTYRVMSGNWRFVGVAATAVVTGTSQHGGLPDGSLLGWVGWLVIIAVNFAIAGTIGWFSWLREEQNERRRQMIAELTEANAKLEAALLENAGLHAQLLEQAREAGVLDERQRMAREIHDTLAQGLVGIITQLEAAGRSPTPDLEWRHHADAAIQLARESLAEARRSVQALQPEPLDRARLPEALAGVTAKWSTLSGVPTTVATTGEPRPMRPEIETALLRTAQEALANVAKHARAHRVVVTLSYMDDVVGLDVRDDGVGFAALRESTADGGFGLTAMRQRVQGLAGAFEIESEPGAGTAVSASIPAIPIGAM